MQLKYSVIIYLLKQLIIIFILGRFNQTTCLVYNITYQGKTQCLTDQRKRDYYDCYTILVKHNTNNVTKETRISGMLHSSGVKVVMHNNAEVSKFVTNKRTLTKMQYMKVRRAEQCSNENIKKLSSALDYIPY